MKKEISIVLSKESRNYRKVAQIWYGLTDEQMEGMDVHHNPPKHLGGRNIPEHLYVYHSTLHSAIHENEFPGWAREASAKAHEIKDEQGRSILGVENSERLNLRKDEKGRSVNAVKGIKKLHAELNEFGQSVHAIKAGQKAAEKTNSTKDEFGRSVNAVKGGKRAAEKVNAEKDEFGRSVVAVKRGKVTSSQKWEDPDHPELGQLPPGPLSLKQKARGLPYGPQNRVRVG